MDRVLAVAAHHGHDVLVLGAWGCGVFANDPEAVADWFARLLTGDGPFRGVFRHVVFAVLDRSGDGGNLQPFARCFGGGAAGSA